MCDQQAYCPLYLYPGVRLVICDLKEYDVEYDVICPHWDHPSLNNIKTQTRMSDIGTLCNSLCTITFCFFPPGTRISNIWLKSVSRAVREHERKTRGPEDKQHIEHRGPFEGHEHCPVSVEYEGKCTKKTQQCSYLVNSRAGLNGENDMMKKKVRF